MMEQLLFILVANLPFLAVAAYIEKNKATGPPVVIWQHM